MLALRHGSVRGRRYPARRPLEGSSKHAFLECVSEFHIPFNEVAGDDITLNLICSLEDTIQTHQAIPAFDWQFLGVAHTTVNLHDAINDTIGHGSTIQL